MSMHELSLENLKDLDDGRANEAFKQCLRRIVGDCQDRPGVATVRKLDMTFHFKPIMAADGELDEIKVVIEMCDRLPKRSTKTYSMAPRRGGLLAFNDLSDDDINQRTIDEQS